MYTKETSSTVTHTHQNSHPDIPLLADTDIETDSDKFWVASADIDSEPYDITWGTFSSE